MNVFVVVVQMNPRCWFCWHHCCFPSHVYRPTFSATVLRPSRHHRSARAVGLRNQHNHQQQVVSLFLAEDGPLWAYTTGLPPSANPSKHGKCLADGATMVQKGFIKGAAHDDYGDGTQALVRHLATKHPGPNSQRKARHFKGDGGLFCATRYIYIYYPDDAFDDSKIVDAGRGYAGSSKGHFYVSHGNELYRRNDICTCLPCLKGEIRSCQLENVFVKGSRVTIPARIPLSQPVTRSLDTLEQFCNSLKIGDYVVLRIHSSGRSVNPEDDYHVDRLEERPYKLTEGGVYGGNQFNAGWFVARMCWLNRADTDGYGNIFYRKGHSQLLQCNAFVRGLKDVKLEYDRRRNLYKLSQSLDERIQRYGNLAS
jgi:hypothetical protein